MSDRVGACLNSVNRSLQFCRDHFGGGCSPPPTFERDRPPPAPNDSWDPPSDLALRLQPELDQAADRFGAADVILHAPSISLIYQRLRHPHGDLGLSAP